MSDRRYTVRPCPFCGANPRVTTTGEAWELVEVEIECETPGCVASVSGKGMQILDGWNRRTPDPVENGTEVVERLKDWISYYKDENVPVPLASMLHGLTIDGLARRLANFLTAEVTRQVEERTNGYREALEEFANEGAWDINRKFWGKPSDPVRLARQALANKGGSDD